MNNKERNSEVLKKAPVFLGFLISILPVVVLADMPVPLMFPLDHPTLQALLCSPHGRSLLCWIPLMVIPGILFFICRESPRWKNIGLLDVIVEICIFLGLFAFFTDAAWFAFFMLGLFSCIQLALLFCAVIRWVWLRFDKRCGLLALRRFLVVMQVLLGLALMFSSQVRDLISWQRSHCSRCGEKLMSRSCPKCDCTDAQRAIERAMEHQNTIDSEPSCPPR